MPDVKTYVATLLSRKPNDDGEPENHIVPSIPRRASFKTLDSCDIPTFIPHQNLILLLFGETKAQRKSKYIKRPP